MPIQVYGWSENLQAYGSPFVGPIDHTAPVRVDPSDLFESDWLDARGWLKPGTPFTAAGALTIAAATPCFGVLIEATRVLKVERGAEVLEAGLDALGDRNFIVATKCQLNRDLLEDILGRALSADEIAGLGAAPGGIVLIA